MPTTVPGVPGRRGARNAATKVSRLTPGTLENVLPDSVFELSGPHNGGSVAIKVSQNQAGCAKNIVLALYIDGVQSGSWVQGMAGDSTAGTDRTYTFPIPWENRAVTRRYWLTWTTPCGTGEMDSASRVVTFSPNVPDRVGGPFGLAQGVPDTMWRDGFSRSVLGQWWKPVRSGAFASLSAVQHGGVILKPTATNKRMQGYYLPVPPQSFTIKAIMRDPSSGTTGGSNDIRGGIFTMVDGSTGWVIGPFHQDAGAGIIGVTTASTTADWSSTNGTTTSTAGGRQKQYLWYRMTYSKAAATIATEYSGDGVTWTAIASARTSVTQPTHVGFGIYSNTPGLLLENDLVMARWGITFP